MNNIINKVVEVSEDALILYLINISLIHCRIWVWWYQSVICGHVFSENQVASDWSNTSYRFSAFWLWSKCSICSYQLNIWYDPHAGSTILNWFLDHGKVLGACSTFAADRPSIALPLGMVHEISNQNELDSPSEEDELSPP